MSNYYKDLNLNQESDNTYKRTSNFNIKDYNLNKLLDSSYYKTKETKITVKTHVYFRKTN